jgi:predicted KAP-like P-loop ATPase
MNNHEEPIWAGDLLNREAEADFLVDFLVARMAERKKAQFLGSYVLNINAAWGEGKTFFLERLAKTLCRSGHVVASVNAWSDDHADDPLLPVMAAIESAVDRDGALKDSTKKLVKSLGRVSGQVAAAAAKGAVKQAAKRFLGEEAADLIKLISDGAGLSGKEIVSEVAKELDKIWDDETKALLNRFKEDKKSILQFQEFLHKFVSRLEVEGRGSLFVLIDELDRCRPPYAIALLERVKHLFDVSDVIFVVATDTEQLQHSVAAVYGNAFDSTRYLGRFFQQDVPV